MKGKDRWIVGVILAAVLAAGLYWVTCALDRARETQTAALAAAQYNGGEIAPEGPSGGPELTLGSVVGTEEPELSSVPTVGSEAADAASGGEGAGQTPGMGGGDISLAELVQWMQTESGGALAADSALAAETALASGSGSEDDAERRAFALSQSPDNDRARRNLLAEEAATLGLEVLRCRDLLALREESAAFCRDLEQKLLARQAEGAGTVTVFVTEVVEKTAETEGEQEQPEEEENTPEEETDAESPTEEDTDGKLSREEEKAAREAGFAERMAADLQTVQDAAAAAELEAEKARADWDAAIRALNTALGNDVSTPLEVTDELVLGEQPDLSEDAAAAQALMMRNEIKAADYNAAREAAALNQLRYEYPTDAPEYQKQQAVVMQAQTACPQVRGTVESDVRDRWKRLTLLARELELCSASLDRLNGTGQSASYAVQAGENGEWTSNISTLLSQWTQRENYQAQLISGTARYNLECLCFAHAIDVGCTAAVI